MSYLIIILVAILFTTHEPVSKLIANEINPYALTAIRFFLGSLVCLPLSIRDIIKNKLKLGYKDFLILGGLGILDMCAMVILQIGVKVGDSPALISILFSANSIFTIILSVIFLKNKFTKAKLIGMIFCILGVILSIDFSKGGTNGLSIVLALLSALIFSVYTVLCKKNMHRFTGSIQTGISFFMGSSILILVLMICNIDIVGGIALSNLAQISYLSFIVTGLGFLLYFTVLKKSGPDLAALTYIIKPILTPFVAWIVNDEVPRYTIIIAVILVAIGASISGGAIGNLAKARKAKKALIK